MTEKLLDWKGTDLNQRVNLEAVGNKPYRFVAKITEKQYARLHRYPHLQLPPLRSFVLTRTRFAGSKTTALVVYTNAMSFVESLIKEESAVLNWTNNTTRVYEDYPFVTTLTQAQAVKVADFMDRYPTDVIPFKATTKFKAGYDAPTGFTVYANNDHVRQLVEAVVDGKPAALAHNGAPLIDPLTEMQLDAQIDYFVTAYRNLYAQAVAHMVERASQAEDTAILSLVPDSHLIAKSVLALTADRFAPAPPTMIGLEVHKLLKSIL